VNEGGQTGGRTEKGKPSELVLPLLRDFFFFPSCQLHIFSYSKRSRKEEEEEEEEEKEEEKR